MQKVRLRRRGGCGHKETSICRGVLRGCSVAKIFHHYQTSSALELPTLETTGARLWTMGSWGQLFSLRDGTCQSQTPRSVFKPVPTMGALVFYRDLYLTMSATLIGLEGRNSFIGIICTYR